MDQDDDDGSETNYLGTSKGGLRNGVLKKAFFVILYNRKFENHPKSRIGFQEIAKILHFWHFY